MPLMDSVSSRHVDLLDDIRGIAIVGVFAFHCLAAAFGFGELPWSGWFRNLDVPKSFLIVSPLMFGSLGVALFFVVSGFCIHLSFRRSPDWYDFFWRRFFRIYPPYFFAVLLFALVYPGTRLSFSSLYDYAQLVSHVFLFHNLDERSFFGINPAFWSIGVEVQLYLLYPFVIALSRRHGWKNTMWLLAIVEGGIRVVCMALELLGRTPSRLVSGSPLSYWFSWGLGAYLAERFLQNQPLPLATWSIGALTVAAFGSAFFKPTLYFVFPLFSLLTAAVIAQRLSDPRVESRIPEPVSHHLRIAGIWSFSLYLLHQPLLKSVMLVVPDTRGANIAVPLVRLAVGLASWIIILPLAGLAYRWWEQPSIALGKRWLRKYRLSHPAIGVVS
jgi:peptidoglycan/LPS O-acetylase OafA/YrhL